MALYLHRFLYQDYMYHPDDKISFTNSNRLNTTEGAYGFSKSMIDEVWFSLEVLTWYSLHFPFHKCNSTFS